MNAAHVDMDNIGRNDSSELRLLQTLIKASAPYNYSCLNHFSERFQLRCMTVKITRLPSSRYAHNKRWTRKLSIYEIN